MKNNKDNNLEQKIMGQIKSGKVRLRSRYIFMAQKFGLGGSIVFSLILATLVLSLIFSSLRMTGNLEYLSFGRVGVFVFLRVFPYGLVIVSAILILLLGYLVKRLNWSHKIKMSYLSVAIIGAIIILSFGIGLARVSDMIANIMLSHRTAHQVITPRECDCGFSLRGRIDKCQGQDVWVETFCGPRQGKLIDDKLSFPADCEDKMIISTGREVKGVFEIEQFKILPLKQMPQSRQRFYRNMTCPNCQNN